MVHRNWHLCMSIINLRLSFTTIKTASPNLQSLQASRASCGMRRPGYNFSHSSRTLVTVHGHLLQTKHLQTELGQETGSIACMVYYSVHLTREWNFGCAHKSILRSGLARKTGLRLIALLRAGCFLHLLLGGYLLPCRTLSHRLRCLRLHSLGLCFSCIHLTHCICQVLQVLTLTLVPVTQLTPSRCLLPGIMPCFSMAQACAFMFCSSNSFIPPLTMMLISMASLQYNWLCKSLQSLFIFQTRGSFRNKCVFWPNPRQLLRAWIL